LGWTIREVRTGHLLSDCRSVREGGFGEGGLSDYERVLSFGGLIVVEEGHAP